MGTSWVKLSVDNYSTGTTGFLEQQHLRTPMKYAFFCQRLGKHKFCKSFSCVVTVREWDHLCSGEVEAASSQTAQRVCAEAVVLAEKGFGAPPRRPRGYLIMRLLQGSQDVQYRLRTGFQVIIHQGVYEHRTTVWTKERAGGNSYFL